LQRAGPPRLGALEQENDNGGVEPATGCSASKSLSRKRCRNQAEQSYRNSSTAAPGVELELASSKWYAEHHGELTSMLTMYRHAADCRKGSRARGLNRRVRRDRGEAPMERAGIRSSGQPEAIDR